jgi:AbrB family looped-hinge helix DNA binding protein
MSIKLLAIAKVSSRGLIRLPKAIMAELGIQAGDELLFLKEEDGRIFIRKGPLIIERVNMFH